MSDKVVEIKFNGQKLQVTGEYYEGCPAGKDPAEDAEFEVETIMWVRKSAELGIERIDVTDLLLGDNIIPERVDDLCLQAISDENERGDCREYNREDFEDKKEG